MTRLWLIRLGKNGEYEAAAVNENVLTIGFGIREDLSGYKDRDSLIGKMAELFPDDKTNRHKNFGAQVNQFLNVAQTGDLVVTPFKMSSTISIGEIAGPYKPGPNGDSCVIVRVFAGNVHCRPRIGEWVKERGRSRAGERQVDV